MKAIITNHKYFWLLVIIAFASEIVSVCLIITSDLGSHANKLFYLVTFFSVLKSVSVIIAFKLSRKYNELDIARFTGGAVLALDVIYYIYLYHEFSSPEYMGGFCA